MVITYLNQFISIPYDLIGYYLPNIQQGIIWYSYRNTLDFISMMNIFINFSSGYYNAKEHVVIIATSSVAL